jgi:5,10-methylenetetrahydrofolate reductase
MNFCEKIKANAFVVTSEIGPPKGTNITTCLHDADIIKDRVAAVNVTDIQSSVMRVGSMAICRLLKERGIEPILQMVCRDRNRLALQSDLLSASVLGIENVLCLTGDHPVLGDHPESKPVFDLDSISLLQVATGLTRGYDMKGNKLDGSPKFFLGAVVTPCAEPLEPQIIKMEKKIKAGAQFFQTQAVYEPNRFEKFMKIASQFNVPVLAGIVVLKSVGMAKFMNANVAGVYVPDELITELKKDPAKTKSGETGIEIAARLIKEFKPMCQGIHIMPLGWDDKVPTILERAGL